MPDLGRPARGNTAVVGFAFQLENQVPSNDLFWLKVNTPTSFDWTKEKIEDGSLDPSGYVQPTVPGPIRSNSPELNIRLTSGHLIEFLLHMFGSVQVNAISGGFEYVFSGDASGPDSGFTVFLDMSPVERLIRHTVKFSEFEIPITGTDVLVAKFKGNFMNGQSYDFASDFSGTGTYDNIHIRGPVKYKGLGDIYLQVTNTNPLSFKAEITDGVPIFAGSEVAVHVDPFTLRGDYQNLVGSIKLPGTYTANVGTTVTADSLGLVNLNSKKYLSGADKVGMRIRVGATEHTLTSVTSGDVFEIAPAHAGAAGVDVYLLDRDFGFMGENKDPVEVILAGDSTDFADIDVSDQWRFREEIQPRIPTFTTFDRFSPAHAVHYFREVGSTVWKRFDGISSTIKLMWPLEAEEGHGTRYLRGLDRSGRFSGMLDPFEAVYRERNRELIEWADSHEDLEAKVEILGKQLGDGTYREGHIVYFPATSVTAATRPISGPDRLNISASLKGTTNAAGDSPVIWRTYSTREYTQPTFIV